MEGWRGLDKAAAEMWTKANPGKSERHSLGRLFLVPLAAPPAVARYLRFFISPSQSLSAGSALLVKRALSVRMEDAIHLQQLSGLHVREFRLKSDEPESTFQHPTQ